MAERIYQVDAFTTAAFAGNPAAVCLLSAERSEEWMLAVAGEMNLSETAFVRPIDDGYSLRWFTPTTEVKLCGHATLASAHILWDEGIIDPATGSAHCILGPFWAAKSGKQNLRALQASARGGAMNVRPVGERVYLQGKAITVLAGELRI